MRLSTNYNMTMHGQSGYTDGLQRVTITGVPYKKPNVKGFMAVHPLPGRLLQHDGTPQPGANGLPYQLTPFRQQDGNYGDWVRKYDIANGVGMSQDTRISYICYDPAAPDQDPAINPLNLLWRTCKTAVDNMTDPGGWAGLLKGGRGRAAALSGPSPRYLFQGIIGQNGEQPENPWMGLQPGSPIPIISASSTAFEAMNSVLVPSEAAINEANANPQSVAAVNLQALQRDPLDPAGGNWLNFRYIDGSSAGAVQQFGASPQGLSPMQQPAQGNGRSRYECSLFAAGTIPPLGPQTGVDIASRVRNLSEVLQLLTYEEQAHLLCSPSRFPSALVLRAFMDFPAWITPEAREAAVSRTTWGGFGGYGQQQPSYQPSQQFGAFGMPPGMVPGATSELPPGMPPQQFGAPPQQFGAPPQQFGAPPQQFGAPPQQFGATPQQFNAPPQQFGAPPGMPPGTLPGLPTGVPDLTAYNTAVPSQPPTSPNYPPQFGQPPAAPFGTGVAPPQQFGVPSQQYVAPPQQFGAPSAAPFGGLPVGSPTGLPQLPPGAVSGASSQGLSPSMPHMPTATAATPDVTVSAIPTQPMTLPQGASPVPTVPQESRPTQGLAPGAGASPADQSRVGAAHSLLMAAWQTAGVQPPQQ